MGCGQVSCMPPSILNCRHMMAKKSFVSPANSVLLQVLKGILPKFTKGSNYVLVELFSWKTLTIPLHTNLQIWHNRQEQSFQAACWPNAEGLSFNYRASEALYFDFFFCTVEKPSVCTTPMLLTWPQHAADMNFMCLLLNFQMNTIFHIFWICNLIKSTLLICEWA